MPFLTPLCGLISGILIANQFHNPIWGLIPIIAGMSVYLIILRQSSNPERTRSINPLHYVWIFLIFTGIGFISYSIQKPSVLSDKEMSGFHMAEGVVTESQSLSNKDNILAKITHLTDSVGNIYEKTSLTVMITTPGFSTDPGDIIIFPARFQEITDNPNYRPNGYPERMRRQGIYYLVRLKEGEIKLVGKQNSIKSKSVQLRNDLISTVEKSSLSRKTINFIIALIFGDRSFISDEIQKSFSDIGVSHILALSGLHVGIILIILTILLYPLKIVGGPKIHLFIILLLIWGFALLTGLSPSTVRSCLMLTFGLIAFSLERKAQPLNSLIAATFIILLVSPASLYDIGLQLSVICVASILIFTETLNPIKRHHHPHLYSLLNAVIVSLIASLSSWVVISHYFKTVPILFIPANLLFLPILPFFMASALFYIILLTFGIDASWLAFILDSSYSFFQYISKFLQCAGETTIHYQAGIIVIFFWLTAIIAIGYSIRSDNSIKKMARYIGCALFALSILFVFLTKESKINQMIIQNNFDQISVVVYEGDNQYNINMPSRSIGRLHKGDFELISIDCRIDTITLKNFLNQLSSERGKIDRNPKQHLIVLGASFRLKLKDIPGIRNYDKIILHSSIRRKMEANLIKEAKEMKLTNIHSLREDGPLKLSFDAPLARR